MNTTRNEMKKLASVMENLAHTIQVKLDAGEDILALSNELVRNSSTFVFTLGEMYALERNTNTRTVKANKTSGKQTNYHNVRDALGRFTRKV